MPRTSSTGRRRTFRLAAVGVVVALCAGALFVRTTWSRSDVPLVVGVMLPLSGPADVGWRQPLEWALDAVNDAGGVDGRPIELRYVDIAADDAVAGAERLAQDDSVVAVIGPDTSTALFDVAPIFLKAQKPLVSPSSTSGDVTRAFSGSRYIWRTTSSDIGQLRAMLRHLADRHVTDVALLTTIDPYGSTFFDWFGFLATELGMHVTENARMEPEGDCAEPVARVRASHPQVVIAAPGQRATAVCVAKQMQDRSDIDLLFSDGALFPALIDELGPQAAGLTGVGLAPDPAGGFADAYAAEFGRSPVPYAANTYDALLLLAYGLERSHGEGGDGLVDAIIGLTSAEGAPTGWDHASVAGTLAVISDGGLPHIGGATGALDYGKRTHIDLVSSRYAVWHVDGGSFRFDAPLAQGVNRAGNDKVQETLDLQQGSEQLKSPLAAGDRAAPPEPRTGMWALIVAGSSGWGNYRHQADALAQYRILRRAGLSDDRIVLVLADDIASAPENPEPGVVRNAVNGPDLYEDVHVDYRVDALDAADILHILAGQRSERLPKVIDSTANDDVYVYFSGHGSDQGMFIGTDRPADRVDGASRFTPEGLAATIGEVDSKNGYRRLLVAVEMCEAGAMGRALTAPDAVLISAANENENSLATNYWPGPGAWLGDQFSVALVQHVETDPGGSLGDLYRGTYLAVSGSHVSVYNAVNFGDLDATGISEFFQP